MESQGNATGVTDLILESQVGSLFDTESTAGRDSTSVGPGWMAEDRKRLSHHLRWELQQMMSRVRPDDLSVAEIVALLDILKPANSRVIGGPACRP